MLNIKELRMKKGLTQETLAEKIGVTQGVISQWEYGITSPSSAKLPKLAEVLGCGIADLFAMPEKKEGE